MNRLLKRITTVSALVLIAVPVYSSVNIITQSMTQHSTVAYADDTYKDIHNAGRTLSKERVALAVQLSKKYQILPSLIIVQPFLESQWGTAESAPVARVDNNWSGIGYPGGNSPGMHITKGTGSTDMATVMIYAHYDSVEDWYRDYCYLLRKGNQYNVAGQADYATAIKGYLISGGAKANYYTADPNEYQSGQIVTRSAINKNNDNYLDKLDKMVVGEGDWNGSVPDEEKQADNTEEAVKTLSQNDKFIVNGYGSMTSKEWKENIKSAEEYVKDINPDTDLDSSQKSNLNEWVDDYKTSKDVSTVTYTRLAMSIVGYACLIYALLLSLAFAFDKVGILEISALSLISFGKLDIALYGEDSTFLKKKVYGEPKRMAVKDLIIINLLLVGLFVLIITGALYSISYSIYSICQQIIEWGNSLH